MMITTFPIYRNCFHDLTDNTSRTVEGHAMTIAMAAPRLCGHGSGVRGPGEPQNAMHIDLDVHRRQIFGPYRLHPSLRIQVPS